jgi:hypothetical protein
MLAAQLVRVAAIREQYEEAGRCSPNAMVGPAIAMMTAAINYGIEAARTGDVADQARATAELSEFSG